ARRAAVRGGAGYAESVDRSVSRAGGGGGAGDSLLFSARVASGNAAAFFRQKVNCPPQLLPGGQPLPIQIFPETRLVNRVRAREGRAVLDDVTHRPGHAPLVGGALGLVVGAQYVEVAAGEAFEHEVGDLVARPGAGRLLGGADGEAGEGEAGDQEMGRE